MTMNRYIGTIPNKTLLHWQSTLLSCTTGIVLWTLFFAAFASIGFENTSTEIVVSFLLNGFIFYCMIVISVKKRAFSLDLIHWFFLFSFMFFAPFVQYLRGEWAWGDTFSDQRILTTNFILDGWTVFYLTTKILFSYVTVQKNAGRLFTKKEDRPINICVHKTFLVFCVAISVCFSFYLLLKYGKDLFSRGTNTAYEFSNSTLTLLVSLTVPAFITGVTAMAIYNVKPRGTFFDWLLLAAQCFALLISCFPLGLSRFLVAVIYIGLALTAGNFFRKRHWFLCMMIFGLIIIFPVLNAFRRVAIDDVNILTTLKEVVTSILDDLTEGHYDAYMMFMLVQEYVAESGVAYGMQLVGVLLFWIPRAIWPGKPFGSGQTAAEFFNKEFTNLSCPLPAEGYINFGIGGTLLFAMVLAVLIHEADNRFWEGKGRLIKVLYPFIIPFLFFVMRGDLLSSFSYLTGFSITVAALFTVNAMLITDGKEKRQKSLKKDKTPSDGAKIKNKKKQEEL